MRLACTRSLSADLARECTQDAFVRAFKTLEKFRGDAKLSTWLYRITVSVVTDATRKVRRLRERETDLDEWGAYDVPAPGIDPELRDRLHRAIDALPEIYRVTVIMHDLEGYTHQEIADALGVAEGTCKSRLFLARAQLRAALADVAEE
jgi:RNA polymerase sigma-70 factor, ECF subfamily